MKKDNVGKGKLLFDEYLESNHLRKTPERYAILNAVYEQVGIFSIGDLSETLEKDSFIVSRATLYNTLKLFEKIHLIVSHKIRKKTRYESCVDGNNSCLEVCTVCGSVKKANFPQLDKAIASLRTCRFRKKGFSLYIYGVCSSCQSRMKRKKQIEEKNK